MYDFADENGILHIVLDLLSDAEPSIDPADIPTLRHISLELELNCFTCFLDNRERVHIANRALLQTPQFSFDDDLWRESTLSGW
jgi:hypothetical protein